MKVNLMLNEENVIYGIRSYPVNDEYPIIEIDNIQDIHCMYDKYENGKLIKNEDWNVLIKNEKLTQQIVEYKRKLKETDYQCLKYIDGDLTEEEYSTIKEMRKTYRSKINELEEELK